MYVRDLADIFVPARVPKDKRASVAKLLSTVDTYAKLLKVQSKDSKKMIPFAALPMQRKIFDAVNAGAKRIVILKARQVAATTGCKLVLQWLASTTKQESMYAIVSMRDDSATSLLAENRRWVLHPPKILQRQLDANAKGGITFQGTKASVKAFTARSKDGLRSFSPAGALISEAAFAPDLEEVIAQVDAAVGDGLLMVESTANNPGDFFSKLVLGAPENGWTLISMWWWEHPLYCDPPSEVPEDFQASLTNDEKALQSVYGLSLGQLHWRRRTEARLGSAHKFRREYPACIDDCFLDRKGGYFEDSLLGAIQVFEEQALHGGLGREIEPPDSEDRYVMGVDVSGGVGGDYSTLCVVSVGTRQVVYVERSNTSTPAQWAQRAVQVATRYNSALILAESNNHGHAFLLEINYCKYRNLWLDPKTGKPWVTTLQSKLDAFDTLRESLQLVRILDRVTWMELRSLTIMPGKIAPEAPKGAHDDAAVACALAFRALRDVPPSWRTAALNSSPRDRVADLLASNRARRIKTGSLPF